MTLALFSPVGNFIGMVWGMSHQIKIVHELKKENLSAEEISKRLSLLYVPRMLYGIFCGVINMLYGLELHNYWMVSTCLIALVLNLILTSIIWNAVNEVKSSSFTLK